MAPPVTNAAPLDDYADPRDFYTSYQPSQHSQSPRSHPSLTSPPPLSNPLTPPASVYAHSNSSSQPRNPSRSPTRRTRKKDQSALLSQPPRPRSSQAGASKIPQRNFKDLVVRFNKDADNGERPIAPLSTAEGRKRAEEARPVRYPKPKSPVRRTNGTLSPRSQSRQDPAFSRPGMSRLNTAIPLHSSHSHTFLSSASSANSPSSGGATRRRGKTPLFGEVTHDGSTNFGYGISPARHTRRGSESSIMTSSNRSHNPRPAHVGSPTAAPASAQSLHMRSQSDHAAIRHDSHQWTNGDFSHLADYTHSPLTDPALLSHTRRSHRQIERPITPPPIILHAGIDSRPSPSRTPPVSKYSRHRQQQSQMPTSPTRRVDAARPANTDRTLRAYITAPAAQKSPPLRSSRPRQPVSLATTSSSRAKASDRFEKQARAAEDAKPRPRRQIPQLGRDDFAARRDRIQRAISQHLTDDDQRSTSRGPRSSSGSLTTSSPVTAAGDRTGAQLLLLEPFSPQGQDPLHVETTNLSDSPSTERSAAETEFEEDDDSPDLVAHMGRLVADRGVNGQPSAVPAAAVPDPLSALTTGLDPQSLFTTVVQFRNGTTPDTPERRPSEVPSGVDSTDKELPINVTINGKSVVIGQMRPESDSSFESAPSQPSTTDDYLEHEPEQIQAQSHLPMTPTDSDSQLSLPERSDVTPRQIAAQPASKEDDLQQSRQKQARAEESFMQRIIREYETTGQVNPEFLDELEQLGLNSSGTINTSGLGSDAETIQILLDRQQTTVDGLASPPLVPWYAGDVGDASRQVLSSRASTQHEDFYKLGLNIDGVSHHDSDSATMDQEHEKHVSTDSTEILPSASFEGFFGQAESASSSGAKNRSRDQTPGSEATDDSAVTPSVAAGYSLPELDIGTSIRQSLGLDTSPERSMKAPPSPPAPAHAPPPVPPVDITGALGSLSPDASRTFFEDKSPDSPLDLMRFSQANVGSFDMRPSQDSGRADSSSVPPSQSISSASFNAISTDRSSPATVEEPKEQSPLLRRLTKRRNIIKELVDTEYSYHQDMKIIEDIYKATAGPLMSVDERKILFSNSDAIETLSLKFYDAIRRAVAPCYVPPKTRQWQAKRGSFGTSSSVEHGSNADVPSEEQDKLTAVGSVFAQFLPLFETAYSTYLKNHDAASKRLAVLQQDPHVAHWLKECHANASDITAAWDLDSLLVKPVQRILKYPLLLQQLLETTPDEHPDHAALQSAVLESINISGRINEAKKRADLVESIVNRKRKDSDMRSGLAKAFGLRTEKVRERIGIKNEFQDGDYEEIAMKFGGHYVRLQVVMRDVQGSLSEVEKAVARFTAFAEALESFIDVGANLYPTIESKWRKFILAIRELSAAAFVDHKAQVERRVIEPIITALRLHESPQTVMAKRKKRVIDYVRCQQLEKAGQKPDKKTQDGAELYMALNEQLKLDLPKLYNLTAQLIQRCLACQHQIQLGWLWTWEMKLRPVLDSFPASFADIQPAFKAEYDLIEAQVYSLGLCNGMLLASATQIVSPQLNFDDNRISRTGPSGSRANLHSAEPSPALPQQTGFVLSNGKVIATPMLENTSVIINGQQYGRSRASSATGARGRALSQGPPQPPARLSSTTPKQSFSSSRPGTSSRPSDLVQTTPYSQMPYNPAAYQRANVHETKSEQASRRTSGASMSYFNVKPATEQYASMAEQERGRGERYSGLFSSAMPMGESPQPPLQLPTAHSMSSLQDALGPPSLQHLQHQTQLHGFQYPPPQLHPPPSSHLPSIPPLQQQQQHYQPLPPQLSSPTALPPLSPPMQQPPKSAPSNTPVLFVAASLFEFNIDRARREAGYPYLTYVQGEVFDVVAQKGELWLAMNQDDGRRCLGWIWEQHFVILGRE